MSSALRRFVRRTVASSLAASTSESNALRILTYHRVNPTHPRDRLSVHPEAFLAQMELLARSRRMVVHLPQALPGLRGAAPIPAGAVALTFDDGFADNLQFAAPILDHHGFSATFFLPTAHIGAGGTLDRYHGCCDGDRLLGWTEVRALVESGHAVGGHGHRHRELHDLRPAEARADIDQSARELEEHTGRRPRLFCYPRGKETAETRRLVAEVGYEAACTVRPGANRAGADLLALSRTEVSGDDDLEAFELKLAGGFDRWHRLVQGAERAVRQVGL